jgi:hypothetical protein
MGQGAKVVGHKIGLTSRAMQLASKMTEPDYGRILDDALFNDGAAIRGVSALTRATKFGRVKSYAQGAGPRLRSWFRSKRRRVLMP